MGSPGFAKYTTPTSPFGSARRAWFQATSRPQSPAWACPPSRAATPAASLAAREHLRPESLLNLRLARAFLREQHLHHVLTCCGHQPRRTHDPLPVNRDIRRPELELIRLRRNARLRARLVLAHRVVDLLFFHHLRRRPTRSTRRVRRQTPAPSPYTSQRARRSRAPPP